MSRADWLPPTILGEGHCYLDWQGHYTGEGRALLRLAEKSLEREDTLEASPKYKMEYFSLNGHGHIDALRR